MNERHAVSFFDSNLQIVVCEISMIYPCGLALSFELKCFPVLSMIRTSGFSINFRVTAKEMHRMPELKQSDIYKSNH